MKGNATSNEIKYRDACTTYLYAQQVHPYLMYTYPKI